MAARAKRRPRAARGEGRWRVSRTLLSQLPHLHEVRAQGNKSTCLPPRKAGSALDSSIKAQASERSEESRSQHAAFFGYLDNLPFEVEPKQLRVIRKLLARSPLALKQAEALAICPPIRGPRVYGFTRFPCKQYRLCCYCPERRATKHADKLIGAATAFNSPVAVLLTCPTSGELGLGREFTTMRSALRRMARLSWFAKVVRAGALAFECPLQRWRKVTHWHLHAHGVVDAANLTPAFKARCDRQWKAFTGNKRARFGFQPVKSLPGLVSYALKLGDRPSSWAPALGAMTDEQRARLDEALAGRRMTAAWRAR